MVVRGEIPSPSDEGEQKPSAKNGNNNPLVPPTKGLVPSIANSGFGETEKPLSEQDSSDNEPKQEMPTRPNSLQEVTLTPQNEAMYRGIITGIRATMFSEFTPTYELSEKSGEEGLPSFMDGLSWRGIDPARSGITSLPQPHYLSKVMFLRNRPEEEGQPSRFQLAIQTNTYSLDATTARDLTLDQLKALQFAWPDSVQITLLDHEFKNRHRFMFYFDPDEESFEISHGMGDLLVTNDTQHPTDQIANAYRIVYDWSPKRPFGHLNTLQQLRIIDTILQNGMLDRETTKRFQDLAKEDPGTTDLSTDIPVVMNSMPYFQAVIDGSLINPAFRLAVARWQHDYDPEYWANVTSKK